MKTLQMILTRKNKKMMKKTTMSENSREAHRRGKGYEFRIYPGTFNAETRCYQKI